MSEYYRNFEIESARLSSQEKKMVELLKKAAKLCGELYHQQENTGAPGANFYPHGVSKEEIQTAAQENPEILSHYTVVERDDQGKLVPVPYHEKYSEEVEEIAQLLENAAEYTEDEDFAHFLQARAQSFRDDSWSKSEDLWLALEGNKIDVLIGPIEPYLDDLFSVKYAYQANVRITCEEGRYNPQDYLRVIRTLHASSPVFSTEDGDVSKKIRVRVDDVLALAGWHAKLRPVGTNLPNNPDKVARLGTKIIIYTDDIRYREGKITYEAFRRVFPKEIAEKHERNSMLDAAVRGTMLHEITEAVVKYPNQVERLGDMYTPVKELNATVTGVRSCTFHVLKGIITQKDYEEILLIFISWLFESWLRKGSSQGINHYFRGYVVAFNFFLEQKALEIKEGTIYPDFEKLFVAVTGLSSVLSHLMASGSEGEAQRFFEQYGDESVLEQFTPKLEDISVDI